MSASKFDHLDHRTYPGSLETGARFRCGSMLRHVSCLALGVICGVSVMDRASAAQPEDASEKPPQQTKVLSKEHPKRKASNHTAAGQVARKKPDAKAAAPSVSPAKDSAAATAAHLASLDKKLGYKGWNIAFPSYADTVLQDYGGFRSKLAEYGFGVLMLHGPVGAVNMLPALKSGPGPSNGPGRGSSTQQYWGQVPSAIYGNAIYLTYDTSRWGVPDGQIAVASSFVWSTWDHFTPNRFGLTNLSWYQTLFDKRIELKIGYLHNGQEFVGQSIGGRFASPFGAGAAIPSLMGMAPSGDTQPTVRTTWHITDNIYNEFAAIRSLPVNGPTRNIVYDDTLLNPTGFKFNVPNGGLLVVDEVGWQNKAAPGRPQTWVRAGAMYNMSRFANYETGGTDSGVAAGYFLADRQLWQVAPDSPKTAYRGLYAGVTAMYAPPEYAGFSQSYGARLYTIGFFDWRPNDLIALSYNRNEFSRYLVSSINLTAPQTGIFAHQDGSNTVTLSYTARLRPGIYFNGGVSYTDHPSLTYVKNQGADLNLLASLNLVF